MRTTLSRSAIIFTLAAVTLTLSGCGGGDAPIVSKKSDHPQRVVTSSSDCSNTGILGPDECAEAVERAIQTHNEISQSYPNRRLCEKTESEGRCEQTVDGQYRARLAAYLVTASEPPAAVPLYFIKGATASGFRDLDGTNYLEADLEIAFSEASVTVSESILRRSARR